MRITRLQLLTNNIEHDELFYTETLGLPVIHKTANSISIAAGSSELTFVQVKDQNPYYHFAFNIPANKFDEAIAWMDERVEILPVAKDSHFADYKNWNAKAFYFLDYTGNIVEFIARLDLDNATEKAFESDSILEISEIGIVTDDVLNETDQLVKEHKLQLFEKQPRLDHFAAVGADNGLLIVVDKSKNWFPTSLPAVPFNVKVSIDNKGSLLDLAY